MYRMIQAGATISQRFGLVSVLFQAPIEMSMQHVLQSRASARVCTSEDLLNIYIGSVPV